MSAMLSTNYVAATHNYTSTRHSTLLKPQPSAYKTTHTFHVCRAQQQLSCSHPQHNSLFIGVNLYYTPSTTHSTAFHKSPICTQQMQCWDGVKVLQYHLFVRVSFLHALAFIQKTFLWLFTMLCGFICCRCTLYISFQTLLWSGNVYAQIHLLNNIHLCTDRLLLISGYFTAAFPQYHIW